jgi:glycosyltransferase involved in cell wall biosynthesis
MDKNLPLISILVCNFNYEAYITDALKSALNQDYKNTEIVVIDDGSTDRSLSVVKDFVRKHPSQKFIVQAKTKNEGVCRTRNDAINISKGEYFIFLDSDDTMPPDYVSSLYAVAVDKQADVVYGDARLFGDEGGKSNAPEYNPEELLLENYINVSALVKKSKIKDHRFDEKLSLESHEDYDFWVGLSLEGLKFVKAKNTYLNYRIQSQSRNSNTLDFETRMLTFINSWRYIIEKYRKQYTIPDKIFFAQIQHQVKLLASELKKLNDIIQNDLGPEMLKREKHINHLQQALDNSKIQLNNLEEQLESTKKQLSEILVSKDYRVGHWLLSKLKKARRPYNIKHKLS